ncbi:MAG: PilZ domain-containing protein [Deltaproteobacteria bacterium]|nr:PilZ domain-containing protein [Deltaproteobacteria bacterium]
MQNAVDPFDRRKNRGFAGAGDDLDLDQRAEKRRRSVRLPLRLWTEGRHEGKLDFHNCSNLSTTGMFIENPEPYALEALVQIEFNLPGVVEPLKVTGRVMSALDEDTAGENIMGNGFVFTDLGEADQMLVQAFVDANNLTH